MRQSVTRAGKQPFVKSTIGDSVLQRDATVTFQTLSAPAII
jgi:hypothetical protein